MNEQVRQREAKQGRGGKRVLFIMIASIGLMLIGFLFWEGFSGSDGLDEQAVAPTGEAEVIAVPDAAGGTNEVVVPEGGATGDAEIVTVPTQQTPALATGEANTQPAETGTPVVTPEPRGN